MGKEAIEKYRHERLKPEGKWKGDALSCIFYGLENRAPYNWKRKPETREEYMYLVEIAIEYINEHRNLQGAFDLGTILEEDTRDLPSQESKFDLRELIRKKLVSQSQ